MKIPVIRCSHRRRDWLELDSLAALLTLPLHPVQDAIVASRVYAGRAPLMIGLAFAQQHGGEREDLVGARHNCFRDPTACYHAVVQPGYQGVSQ